MHERRGISCASGILFPLKKYSGWEYFLCWKLATHTRKNNLQTPFFQKRMKGFCFVTFSILNEMQRDSYLCCRAHEKQSCKELNNRHSFLLHNYLYYNYLKWLIQCNQHNTHMPFFKILLNRISVAYFSVKETFYELSPQIYFNILKQLQQNGCLEDSYF